MLTILRRLRDEEDGAFFAIAAVVLLALMLCAAFVIDIGNWKEHDRHLQLQVDDGVLAAGTAFSGCFVFPDEANTKIETVARQYAGDPAVPASYNKQLDDPDRVSLGFNSAQFPPAATNYVMDVDGDGDEEPAMPCESKMLDLKGTDAGIPSFFGSLIPDAVNPFDVTAKARVEIKKLETFKGILPWAVPEFNPKAMAVIFVNEASGAVLSSQLLNSNGSGTLNGVSLDIWEADAQILGMTQGVGAVILSSSTEPGSLSFAGTLAQICSQGSNTRCYAGTGATSGLGFFRGLPATIPPGGPGGDPPLLPPQLQDVELQNVTCTESSAPYYHLAAGCTIRVRARIDFGTGAADPTPTPTRARVDIDGTNMTWTAGWFEATMTIANDSGRQNPYTIHWETGTGGGRPQGDFLNVAHPYAANAAAGPIEYFEFSSTAGVNDHTFTIGTSPTVHIALGVRPALRLANAGDDPIILRIASPSGSQNQAIDCDHSQPGLNRNFDDEIRTGCFTPYTTNDTGDCTAYSNPSGLPLPPPNFDPTPIPDCAAIETGDKTGQLRKGLHDRLETPCSDHPNQWPDNPTPTNLPGPEDKRWVVLAVTDLGSFSGSGSGIVPVRRLAGFYITGWDISSQTSGCPDNDPHPLGADDKNDNGDVWGYFVVQVVFAPEGSEPDAEECAFNELGVCIAVLTR
jgi:hypothetical protein